MCVKNRKGVAVNGRENRLGEWKGLRQKGKCRLKGLQTALRRWA
ncbi:hypothetical protein NEIPOLOT_01769 [Neisseria polysaccharea ATCC 43768]|nr:hypothetical protein NEIPOLOT_01769 [Neisseria polysaccharea ATCC 43768]